MWFRACILILFAAEAFVAGQGTATKDVQNGLKNFGFELTRRLLKAEPGKNVVISPIGTYSALSLALLGSSGKTQDEIAECMGFSNYKNNLKEAHQALGNLMKEAQNTSFTELSIADAVFVGNYDVGTTYRHDVESFYDSDVRKVNFAAEGSEATDAINQFVSDKTKGKIGKLFTEPLDKDIQSVLVSALYFEANWDHSFSPELTHRGKFHVADGKDVEVDYMKNTKVVPYFHSTNPNFELIGIPYVRSASYLYIILPGETHGLQNLENSLTNEEINKIIENAEPTYVEYELPKLNLKYKKALVDPLKSMGIKAAFNFSEANFENMGIPNIYVKDVLQATTLEFTEKGTIGSSATAISMGERIMIVVPPKRVTVDRPFYFLISHKDTETVLFTGAVFNPLES